MEGQFVCRSHTAAPEVSAAPRRRPIKRPELWHRDAVAVPIPYPDHLPKDVVTLGALDFKVRARCGAAARGPRR